MVSISLKISAFVTVAVLLAQPGFGQRGGSTSGSTGTGSTSGGVGSTTGTTGTTRNTPTTPTNPSTNTTPGMPTPVFISGRVMLEDGTAPTSSVAIELVCASGNPHTQGYTDGRGYFSVELGQRNLPVLPDAAEDTPGTFRPFPGTQSPSMGGQSPQTSSGSFGADTRFMTCDLRARLAGYRSQSLSLANHRAMDNPDIGVILLHRIAPAEGITVSASTLAAPKDARKAYQKGLDELKKHKTEQAVQNFQKAVSIDANFAAAWWELGKLQAEGNQFDEAHQSFAAAVKAEPKFVPPYIELSLLEYRAQKWQALADVSAEAARLDAFEYPQSFLLNAVANYNLQHFDVAEKSAREAARLDTHHRYPKSYQILGVILANRQDFQGAAEEFRNYLKFAPNASDAASVKSQLDRVVQANAQNLAKPQPQQ